MYHITPNQKQRVDIYPGFIHYCWKKSNHLWDANKTPVLPQYQTTCWCIPIGKIFFHHQTFFHLGWIHTAGKKSTLNHLWDANKKTSNKNTPVLPQFSKKNMLGVSKNNGKTPQIIHLFIGFSMIFTIHFGVFPLFLVQHPC